MSNRITIKMLEARVNQLNNWLGYPTEHWKPYRVDGNLVANPNHYYIGMAYGGYRLEQLCNEGGGARDISPRGTKRETWDYVTAMIAGIEELEKSAGFRVPINQSN